MMRSSRESCVDVDRYQGCGLLGLRGGCREVKEKPGGTASHEHGGSSRAGLP